LVFVPANDNAGLASTALLLTIFSWNEAFWSINLSNANAQPLTMFIASYSSPEGLFWAKLSAASFLAVAPIMVLGWLTQNPLSFCISKEPRNAAV
jgi:sorbitol/mannitol transport system permease protein